MYKLSPSDFKYLWEDCKHCFYRKVVHGIELPSIGMPGIFTKMNNQFQDAIQGMNPQDLHPDLPSGFFELKERYLKSSPIPPGKQCFISGRFDILTKFDDGTYGIIDLKITDPKSEDLYKFTNQLHAYKFALENPAEGALGAGKISKLGLLIISPNSIHFANGNVHFSAEPKWHPIEEDIESFFVFINEVSNLLAGQVPKPTPTCKWCVYRNRFP